MSDKAPGTAGTPSLVGRVSMSCSTIGATPTILKIEQILENVMDSANSSKQLRIPFFRRPSRTNQTHARPAPSAFSVEDSNTGQPYRAVSFPGASEAEAKLFTQILSILQLSHQSLVTGTLITKRNIFYQHRALFRDQRVVDNLVDDIAYTLGSSRDSLNIVATGVGIVCGQLEILMADGSTCAAWSRESGLVIPSLRHIDTVDLSGCRWILILEKDAAFRTLAASKYWKESLAGRGLLVTSKGYPSLATRLFLHYIHSVEPQIPLYCLVDYDPHGIRIYRTYKYGSLSLSHEESTTVPSLKWLGLHSHGLLQRDHGQCGTFIDGVVPLTESDRKTAIATLAEILDKNTQDTGALNESRELQVMLVLNVKAEIQAADDYGDLTVWLDQKLCAEQMLD